jgi:hypothetical protein
MSTEVALLACLCNRDAAEGQELAVARLDVAGEEHWMRSTPSLRDPLTSLLGRTLRFLSRFSLSG